MPHLGMHWLCPFANAFLFFVFHNDSTIVAHAGDGNFHTIILFDPNNDEHRRDAERLNHYMVCTALTMAGIHSSEAHKRISVYLDNA